VPRMIHKKLFIGALLMAGSPLLQAAEPDPVLVATPRAKVLATTASSRPFLAAARSQQPVDLAARGYVESEVAVRGHINASQPYVTRMLVRRPLDARNFSGRVIVELLDASGQFESAPLWGFSWEYFLRRGDAWVGVTVSPVSADTLKKFNASRYGTLNLATGEAGGCGAVSREGQHREMSSRRQAHCCAAPARKIRCWA
jgi:Alpha/beta hydrolase domain